MLIQGDICFLFIDIIIHRFLSFSNFVEYRLATVLAGPMDEYENDSPMGVEGSRYPTTRCRPEAVANNLAEAARPRQSAIHPV